MKSVRPSFEDRPCNLRCAALLRADLFSRDFCELTSVHSFAVNSAAACAKTVPERVQYLVNDMSARKSRIKPVQRHGGNGLTPWNGNNACGRRSDSTSKFARVHGAFAPWRVRQHPVFDHNHQKLCIELNRMVKAHIVRDARIFGEKGGVGAMFTCWDDAVIFAARIDDKLDPFGNPIHPTLITSMEKQGEPSRISFCKYAELDEKEVSLAEMETKFQSYIADCKLNEIGFDSVSYWSRVELRVGAGRRGKSERAYHRIGNLVSTRNRVRQHATIVHHRNTKSLSTWASERRRNSPVRVRRRASSAIVERHSEHRGKSGLDQRKSSRCV